MAASILGLGAGAPPAPPRAPSSRLLADPGRVAAIWVGVVALAGVYQGPLPWWDNVPLVGSDSRVEQYRVDDHSRAMARAAELIPGDVPVSVGNLFGGHLSERERVYTFPVVADAKWVIVDNRSPYLADRIAPFGYRAQVRLLEADPDWRLVFREDGVMVFRRVAGSAP